MCSGDELSLEMLNLLVGGFDLDRRQAFMLMDEVMQGKISSERLAGLLIALRSKGETIEEITGLAAAMRQKSVGVHPRRNDLVDTCGTGGDGSGTFNISTATAIVSAAMGCAVAKHGNRAVSSACGSADVLEELGVNLNLDAERVAHLVDEVGLGFLFAPQLHPAMKHAMPARSALGVRTVFNVLGPLTNPAGARRQLLGVFSPDLCLKLAQVLQALGTEKAFVVHGEGGLDEVSLFGPTEVAALIDGQVSRFTFHPHEVGLELCHAADLKGGSIARNADIIRRILAGDPGPCTDVVLLNAAFVAVAADRTEGLIQGLEMARQAVADGSAQKVLDQLIQRTGQMTGGAS